MQTQLEVKEGLRRHLTVTVPAETFKNKREEVLKKFSKKAKIQGFRPGNAPKDIVAKNYASEISGQVMDDLLSSTLPEAFQKEGVFPVSRPNVESIKADEGKDFEYMVSFDVAPTIEDVKFDNVSIDKIIVEIKPDDIDRVLEGMTKQFGTYVAKDGPAANGDQVIIDFEGSVDGEKFEGGTATNYPMTLGAGQMIPGFEEGILGMKAGDEKVIDVTFPEQYHADLAGKKAQFKIKVNEVKALQAAEMNAELVKKLGVASGDLAQLKEEINKALTRELKRKLQQDLHKDVFDKLLALNSIEVPESVVHDEIHALMDEAKERYKRMTGQKTAPDFSHDMFKDQAKRRVTNSYLIMKLIEQNQLKADPIKIREMAEEMAASYENPEQVRDYYLNNKEQYKNLENLALEDAVVELLLSKAKVNNVEKSYKDLMGK